MHMNSKEEFAICYSHIGKRLNHEDNFLFNGNYVKADLQDKMREIQCCFSAESSFSHVRFFAVSDGMGGHNAGEVASRVCVEKLALAQKEVQNFDSLQSVVAHVQKTIIEINQVVCSMGERKKEWKGMGATLVLLIIYGMECAVLNIGDSRVYHFNNKGLVQITKDHTEGQRMLDLGILSRKELSGFPARKNLNRYIGYYQNGYILQADEYYLKSEPGVILLCSDGISDFISDYRMQEILYTSDSLENAGRKILEEAVDSCNADNATLILVPFKG